MAEAAHPWPEYIHQSFNSATFNDPSGTDESVFYGPFIRLLYALFGVEGQYEITPHFKNIVLLGGQEGIDAVTVIVVEVNRQPVFFVQINPPAAIRYDSRREEADAQMRRWFRDLRQTLVVPTLHGINAFGTRLSFYEYDSATHALQPEYIHFDTALLTDVAPAGRWGCDVLQQEGADRLRGVIAKVKAMQF